jgi:hypothetical protein
MKKYYGWTWIEWNDEVHTFVLDDQNHLETKKNVDNNVTMGR